MNIEPKSSEDSMPAPLDNEASVSATHPATGEASEPATSEPATSEPATSEPATSEPATSEPESSEPESSEPATSEPATSEPESSDSASGELAAPTGDASAEPTVAEPVADEPVAAEPGTGPAKDDGAVELGIDTATAADEPADATDDITAVEAATDEAEAVVETLDEEVDPREEVEPLELDLEEEEPSDDELRREWYILKVQVNREDSIREALQKRVKIQGKEQFFGDIVVPTEDVAEFTKSGKRRIVKRKLYPGYIMVNMSINDETWFLVRETPGIGDFTGSAGKPTPMDPIEVDRILQTSQEDDEGESPIKTSIPFKPGDRVRVKEGNFENFEGDVEAIDEAKGHVTVLFSIFGRPTPVELPHWQIEKL